MKDLLLNRSVGRHTPFVLVNLGAMYSAGKGVERNREEAMRCWKAASDHGASSSCLPVAQFNLGLAYENLSPPDLIKAVQYYTMAAMAAGLESDSPPLPSTLPPGAVAVPPSPSPDMIKSSRRHDAVASAQSNLGALLERGGTWHDYQET